MAFSFTFISLALSAAFLAASTSLRQARLAGPLSLAQDCIVGALDEDETAEVEDWDDTDEVPCLAGLPDMPSATHWPKSLPSLGNCFLQAMLTAFMQVSFSSRDLFMQPARDIVLDALLELEDETELAEDALLDTLEEEAPEDTEDEATEDTDDVEETDDAADETLATLLAEEDGATEETDEALLALWAEATAMFAQARAAAAIRERERFIRE